MPKTSYEIARRAKQLRRNTTPQETKLWERYLRRCPWKFRRQMPLGKFILDFCCIPLHLVIEVDGAQHETVAGRIRDEERTAFLKAYGYNVIRFSNQQIDEDFESVIQIIAETCGKTHPSYHKVDEMAYQIIDLQSY